MSRPRAFESGTPLPLTLRELTEGVDLADGEGRLRREAVGWSRHPLHRCNLSAAWSRVERFNYWCITSRTSALAILFADVGVAGVALLSFLDLAARRPVERLYVRPGGLPVAMPETPRGDFVLDVRRLRLAMRMRGDELHVEAEARTLLGARVAVDLVVTRPAEHETVNLVVPWDETHFHFTSKQQALPARGVVRVDGREHRFEPANQGFACLDFGRGRWPSGIAWRWAFASATRGAGSLGLNLGGGWTDGTGVTENGVVLDGRVHKIAEDLDFELDRRDYLRPWRIRTRTGGRLDLRFHPMRERAVKLPIVIELHQMIGAFTGTFIDDAGERISIDDVLGVAESFRGRW
jgi:hypothetical protein